MLVFLDDAQIIYDGAVLPKKGFIGTVYNYFASADKHEREKGCTQMLPDWTEEISKGTSPQELNIRFESVVSRQKLVMAAFDPEKYLGDKDLSTVYDNCSGVDIIGKGYMTI